MTASPARPKSPNVASDTLGAITPAATPDDTSATRPIHLERLARLPVFSAAAALTLTLAVLAGQYGYHRDELYFRMLPPAWGYVDQPPLTPLLARVFSQFVADEVWAIRIPAISFAVVSVLVVALITREVGGGRLAQGLSAWGYSFASITLTMGHVLLTASLDLLVWPAVILLIIRALLRNQPRWWLLAGVVVGISMYNKFLIVMLLISLAAGLLVLGPRRILRSKWVAGAILLALTIGAPNLIYQTTNGWPQLAMGAALGAKNGGSVRIIMWPFLLLMLGPPLVPFWIAGITALIRKRQWRPIRSLVVAFAVLLALVCISGGQFYYPYGLLAALYAIGCVPAAAWAARSRPRRVLVIAAIALNSAVCAMISLPIVPIGILGATVIPDINAATPDQVGWPTYVRQIDNVVNETGDAKDLVILTSNYGEAGALARFGQPGQPAVYSGHNALYTLGPPPNNATTALVVGGMLPTVAPYFKSCTVMSHLRNAVGVDNEEQGQPIALCHTPLVSWNTIWPALRHLD
jgi:hypothetical protein